MRVGSNSEHLIIFYFSFHLRVPLRLYSRNSDPLHSSVRDFLLLYRRYLPSFTTQPPSLSYLILSYLRVLINLYSQNRFTHSSLLPLSHHIPTFFLVYLISSYLIYKYLFTSTPETATLFILQHGASFYLPALHHGATFFCYNHPPVHLFHSPKIATLFIFQQGTLFILPALLSLLLLPHTHTYTYTHNYFFILSFTSPPVLFYYRLLFYYFIIVYYFTILLSFTSPPLLSKITTLFILQHGTIIYTNVPNFRSCPTPYLAILECRA